jgi:hypothetical protein
MSSKWKLPAAPVALVISLVLLVSFQACTAAPVPTTTLSAGSTQIDLAQITSTQTPIATITRIPSKTPTATPTPDPAGVFSLKFYPPLIMDYDPALWENKSEPANPDWMINYLQSREMDTCQIGVVGPSGNFPPQLEVVTFGNVRYLLSKSEVIVNELIYALFFEDQSLKEFDYSNGLPVLSLNASPADWFACMGLAEEVLATLHSPSN